MINSFFYIKLFLSSSSFFFFFFASAEIQFGPGATVQVSELTSDSVQLSWPSLSHTIDNEILGYYGYLVTYKQIGETEWNVSALIPLEDAAGQTYRYTLSGLRYNTMYQVRVSPYRTNGGIRETLNPTPTVELKTACVGKGLFLKA